MGHEDHMKQVRKHLPCAVLTISDSRTEGTDGSGRIIIDALEGAGHSVSAYRIVPDSVGEIDAEMRNILESDEIKVVIVNGGTGVTRRDVTPESVTPFLEKRLDGFGELFRMLSYQEIGAAAMMSRAFGGVASGKVVLCLPGSRGAVGMAMEKIIIPQIGHMVLEVEK